MATREMTKTELLAAIERKVRRAKPHVRRFFMQGLQYKTKPELARILRRVRVDRDGQGISL